MSAATQTSEQRRYSRRREGKFWWGLFGGALAWLAHLMLSYLLSEFGCRAGLAAYAFLGVTALAWTLLALSLVTVLAAVGAAFLAHRNRPQRSEEDRLASPEFQGRQQAAYAGLIADCTFAFVIVFESVPIFYYLQHC